MKDWEEVPHHEASLYSTGDIIFIMYSHIVFYTFQLFYFWRETTEIKLEIHEKARPSSWHFASLLEAIYLNRTSSTLLLWR